MLEYLEYEHLKVGGGVDSSRRDSKVRGELCEALLVEESFREEHIVQAAKENK